MIINNTSIVEGLKQGSEKSLCLLHEQFYGMLVAFAKHTVRNPLLAEDFVQDAFCTLWEKRIMLNTEQPVQAFLFKLVYRRCMDYLRKQIAHENFREYSEAKLKELEMMQISMESLIISDMSATAAQKIIEQTLQNLPPQTREIFRLSREQLLKNGEIAQKMGVSVKAIEYHISKALRQFRDSLKEFL
jgi:RNA polymerase sigma-70 factor (family 1)